jgi:hypothetical protein
MPTTQIVKVLTEDRVAQAGQSGQLTARRERLICCGTVRQSWNHLSEAQQQAIRVSEEAAEAGAVKRRPLWRRLAQWAERAKAIYDVPVDPRVPASKLVADRDYNLTCLWHDVVAAVQPWYGLMRHGTRSGLRGFLWSQQNPYLLAVFEDVCPQPDVRLLLPAPDALRTWQEGTVVRLAQAIYHERAWDRLPILGDALEEAGAASQEVLAHCRLGGIHVRGCWLLDWVLNLK